VKTTHQATIVAHLTDCLKASARQSDVFDDWLCIVLACLESMPRHVQSIASNGTPADDTDETRALWNRLNAKYTPAQMDSFSKAFAALMASTEEWADTLGDVYMEFGHPAKHGGQFFTPWPIARMMAEMSLRDIDALLESKSGPVEIYDPCCGSGVMLLAAASCCPKWAIECGKVKFYGNDIDENCVKMARANMMLYGLNGFGIRLAASLAAAGNIIVTEAQP